MPSVYAAVFNSYIVKFGRSKNPHKRIKDHITSARTHGSELTDVFIGQVMDDEKAEGLLLSEASRRFDRLSRESFRFKSLADISDVFVSCRIPFILCVVEVNPYRLVIDANSFDVDVSHRPLGKPLSRLDATETRIVEAMRDYGREVRRSVIDDLVPNMSKKKLSKYLESMVMKGVISRRRNPDPMLGSYPDCNLYKVKES